MKKLTGRDTSEDERKNTKKMFERAPEQPKRLKEGKSAE
jgi:hypothetical protein